MARWLVDRPGKKNPKWERVMERDGIAGGGGVNEDLSGNWGGGGMERSHTPSTLPPEG